MTFEEIITKLRASFSEKVVEESPGGLQPYVVVATDALLDICRYVQSTEELYFDMLSCITGIDLGAEKDQMEVVYNLYSIPYNHHLTLKVRFDRNTDKENLPTVPSLTSIWATANWHERETYDLLGIQFEDHPDLRRILLPNDWEGHPLRKDYQEQEKYHGVTVKYEKE